MRGIQTDRKKEERVRHRQLVRQIDRERERKRQADIQTDRERNTT